MGLARLVWFRQITTKFRNIMQYIGVCPRYSPLGESLALQISRQEDFATAGMNVASSKQ
jgi:hypothetical protein